MDQKLHKICIYSISIAMTCITVAFVLSNILPPASPAQTAQEVAEYYRTHTTQLRIGALFGALGAIFYAPFSAAIAWEVKRMTRSEEAAYVQVILGVIATLALFSPWAVFGAVAFRPERPAEVLHAIYDLAWLPLYLFSATFALQFAFLGWAIFRDKRVRPTFPLWFARFTPFVGVAQALGVFVLLEKTGPLAWDGVIAYWAPLVIFGVWTNLAVKYMADSLKAGSTEEPTTFNGDASQLDSRLEGLEAELAAFRAQVAGAPQGT